MLHMKHAGKHAPPCCCRAHEIGLQGWLKCIGFHQRAQ